MHRTRTIYLLQTNGGQWLIRVAAAAQRIVAEEQFASAAAAQRAFIIEGRHQPTAHMVVIVEGSRPVTIRAGEKTQEAQKEAEQLARVRAAMAPGDGALARPDEDALPE